MRVRSEQRNRRPAGTCGLEWEPGLTNGFLHDGGVDSITHPNGFRDLTISIISPWYWDVNEMPLPDGLTHDDVSEMRLIYRFKDVAEFTISLEGEWVVEEGDTGWFSDEKPDDPRARYHSELTSQRVSRQTIYLWSEIDGETAAIEEAGRMHGGGFRSVRMRLTAPRTITVVFRDCECVPSSWLAYDAWSAYPLTPDTISVPPLRTRPLATEGRYSLVHRGRVCTTRITCSSERYGTEEYYLCDRCLDEWLADYASGCAIPRVKTGSGRLPDDEDGDQYTWERGRFPGRECCCEVHKAVP